MFQYSVLPVPVPESGSPPLADLELAMELFSLCVKIVSIDKILENRRSGEEEKVEA